MVGVWVIRENGTVRRTAGLSLRGRDDPDRLSQSRSHGPGKICQRYLCQPWRIPSRGDGVHRRGAALTRRALLDR